MKAVKINNIVWNLDTVNSENRENVLASLPKVKVFLADNDFDVINKVPGIFKKKYGYGVFTYSYSEIRIVETVEDLLLLCNPKGMKPKKLFLKNGNLSEYGESLVRILEARIQERLRMEFAGVNPYEFPKILDEIQFGVEKVTGMNWEGHSVNELMAPVMEKIRFANAVNLIDKYGEALESEEEEDDEE